VQSKIVLRTILFQVRCLMSSCFFMWTDNTSGQARFYTWKNSQLLCYINCKRLEFWMALCTTFYKWSLKRPNERSFKKKDSNQFPQNGKKKILEIPIQKVIAPYQKKRLELFVSFGNGYVFAKQGNPSSKWKHQYPTIPKTWWLWKLANNIWTCDYMIEWVWELFFNESFWDSNVRLH
jgi:hypothetical protein